MKLQVRYRNLENPVERVLGRFTFELDYLTIEEIIQIGLHEFGSLTAADEWCRR